MSHEADETIDEATITARALEEAGVPQLVKRLRDTEHRLAAAVTKQTELEQKRREHAAEVAITEALGRHRVPADSLRAATVIFGGESRIGHDAAGKVSYVEVAGLGTYATIDDAVAGWRAKGFGKVYDQLGTPTPRTGDAGGSGRAPAPRPSKPLDEMSDDELIAEGNRVRELARGGR